MADIISVHTPRAGGSSFKLALTTAFGAAGIRFDYGDQPGDPAAAVNLDPDRFFAAWDARDFSSLKDVRVIHGHFHVDKYRTLAGARRITFLRHPVDRTISHYLHWQDEKRRLGHNVLKNNIFYRVKYNARAHTVFRYFLENDLTVREFARIPAVRRFYTTSLYRGVDMRRFAFVGRFEDIHREMVRLSDIIDVDMALPTEPKRKSAAHSDEAVAIRADTSLRADLTDILADDIRFYEQAFGD